MDKIKYRLQTILMDSQRPMTSADIAQALGVSTRTVKRKIWDLDAELRQNGALISSGQYGYFVDIKDRQAYDSFVNKQMKMSGELSIDNDIVLRIIELLLLKPYITQDEISREVFISRGTVNKYIKDVKVLLEKEKIFVSNRPHYGYYLIADEIDIRNYMVKVFFNPGSNMEKYSSILISACGDYQSFYHALVKTLYEFDYPESEEKTQNLVKYILVIANRNLYHNYISSFESKIYVSNSSRLLAARVQVLIKEYFKIDINKNELVYISYLFGNYEHHGKDDIEYDASFFERIVDRFFHEIYDVYQQDFSRDDILRRGLMQHLLTSYSRLYINVQLGNPFIKLIKTQYIEAYNYAVLCGNVLHNEYKLQVNEDDLAYIAVHFGASIERMECKYNYKVLVVCESGCGMAELLKARLKSRIPFLNVVYTTSIKKLKDMDLEDVILIISSVPIAECLNKPLILVNPLLLERDIEKIKDYLSDYRYIDEYKKLFSAELFFPRMEADNKAVLLDDICGRMIERGIINDSNKADIISREQLSSTEINKLVALPHCIVESGNSTSFVAVILQKPIQWGKGEAQIIFFGIIARNNKFNRKIFPLLYKLTMDIQKVEELCKITEFERFIHKLFSDLPVEYDED